MHRRLHVLIDDERHERIVESARERGMSVGAVVREAIDRGLVSPDHRMAVASARILSAEPMAVPPVDELLTELDDLRGRRA